MKEEITNVINKLLKPDNFKYYANYGYAYPLLAIDADTIIEFIEKLQEENKSLQSQLKAKEEVEKEFIKYLEAEKDRLAREVSQIYEDSLGKTKLVNEDIFNEINNVLSKYKEILSKGENK